MAAARKQLQAGADIGLGFGLRQNAAATGHHRIGGKKQGQPVGPGRANRQRLFGSQTGGIKARDFLLFGRFIKRGAPHRGGHNSGLRQKRQPTGAFAGEHQRQPRLRTI